MKITFTIHAKNQINERNILNEEVTDSIHHPDKIIKKYGKHFYRKRLDRGEIEIVCERIENNIKVITVYWL